MRARKRLTREESKEVTRMRLIEAAERLFVCKGFDDASVEEISETAGYSRGAFYSNFDNKEQVFLAVIDRRLPKALDDIFQQASEPPERSTVVREWFSSQWRLKDFIALRMEFSRRAMRDVSVGNTSQNSAAENSKRTPLPWAPVLARQTEFRLGGRKSSRWYCWPSHTAWEVWLSITSLNVNTCIRRPPSWCSIA
jgi:AcrR family transcriptional regulator